ncbi:helix-turn-helix transcriptional regulator [Enterococcus faecium]|nr:helix-turn-helix transcriptional regulator [Enterococcus faecium]
MDLAKYAGIKIKELRKKNKITQSDLAKKIGIGKSAISNYESGYRMPKQDLLFKLANFFNESVDIFFPTYLETQPKPTSLDKKIGNLIKQFREEKGVSQELLVKTLGISLNDLKAYETGQKPFTVDTVFHFADALGVTFDDLFPNTTTEYFDEIPAILYLDEENNTIITTNGKKYVVSDKEMQQAKDFLTFLHRK